MSMTTYDSNNSWTRKRKTALAMRTPLEAFILAV